MQIVLIVSVNSRLELWKAIGWGWYCNFYPSRCYLRLFDYQIIPYAMKKCM